MREELKESIKRHEGKSLHIYKDSLGLWTIGYGTLIESISEEEAEWLFEHRLNKVIKDLNFRKPIVRVLPEKMRDVLYEMGYQLGVNGLLKFKKMWQAIEDDDLGGIIREMKDSKWYTQTTSRADDLIEKLKDN